MAYTTYNPTHPWVYVLQNKIKVLSPHMLDLDSRMLINVPVKMKKNNEYEKVDKGVRV